ncbi:MAG: hypothetical protein L0H96_01965 [Humibacillus sp.]|nr:hypothetical protein [Humibacillus sp.]MDN5775660.1 hypothetical protein [Humibacillus sp.]
MKAFDFSSINEIDIWTKDFPPPQTASVYVSQQVTTAAVVAVTDMLCPRFVDVEGAVLLETNIKAEIVQSWKERFQGDMRAVEAMINQERVWDLFPSEGEGAQAALEVVAERMSITWKAAAETQFPDRTFTCTVTTDEDGPNVTITTDV